MKKIKLISSIFVTSLLATTVVLAATLPLATSGAPLTKTIWDNMINQVNENSNNITNLVDNNRWRYEEENQGLGIFHEIKDKDGNPIGGNYRLLKLTISVSSGTSTMNAWSMGVVENNTEGVIQLTNMFGNNEYLTNRPYLVIEGGKIGWKMNHDGSYFVTIIVEKI